MNSRAYTAGFNFKGSDQQKKVGKLSGGERNRLHLAKLLRTGGNLLLLDEPTNDLDVDTLRALEEALLSFAGCAVVISHDRWFLDRIATHVLAFEGDSQVDVVRGQLRGLRGAPPRAARRRGRPPAPHHLQEAHADLTAPARRRGGRPRRAWSSAGSPRARRPGQAEGAQRTGGVEVAVPAEDPVTGEPLGHVARCASVDGEAERRRAVGDAGRAVDGDALQRARRSSAWRVSASSCARMAA